MGQTRAVQSFRRGPKHCAGGVQLGYPRSPDDVGIAALVQLEPEGLSVRVGLSLLARFDREGKLLWSTALPQTARGVSPTASALSLTADGTGLEAVAYGSLSLVVSRLNLDGQSTWVREYTSGFAALTPEAVFHAADNTLVVVGTSAPTGTVTPTSEWFLARFTADGQQP